MRFLVVDVGNTSTAVGLWTNGRVTKVSHCDGGFAEAAQAADALLAQSNNRTIGQSNNPSLAYVSVVPRLEAKWRAFARSRRVGFLPVTHDLFPSASQTRTRRHSPTQALSLDYPKPETIGADRLADAAGAVARYGPPVLVMDFGTALTAAVVTRDGVWRGGVIAPGFPLMRDYLFERTAQLPRMALGRGSAPKVGRSTEEAMRFGALVGYRGMVREIAAQLRANFREDFRLVATGGFAKWALKDSGLDFTLDPTLTLYGAGLICANAFCR